MSSSTTTGFTIADRDYYIGLVAMLTSLRCQGHDFPMVILDLGLTSAQRAVLERDFDARAVAHREVVEWHPHLLGPFPSLCDPAGVVVYLDADLIVTRPLDDLLAAAEAGKICGITDAIVPDRWFAEWQPALSLAAPLRRAPYVNLGCFVFSTRHFPDLLVRWQECCARLADTLELPTDHSQPFALGDQDVLNALLMSEVPAERQWILPPEVQPQRTLDLARTRMVDPVRLSCTIDGHATTILHPVSKPKPWQPRRRQALFGSGYERCLRATVAVSISALEVADPPLPRWLRPGWQGTAWWRLGTWWTRSRRRLAPIRRGVSRGRRRPA